MDYKRQQITIIKEVKETYQREVARLERLLQELECESLENDEGDIISYADYFDLESRRR